MKWFKIKAGYQDDIKKEKIFDSAAYILKLIEDGKKNYLN